MERKRKLFRTWVLNFHFATGFFLLILTYSAQDSQAREYEDFIFLSVESISASGTEGTLPENGHAFISNPAAVTRSIFPTISHSHSARHFPRRSKLDPEMDQLDCDIETLTIPLPIGRLGYAFSLMDELGYDFSNHPVGRFPFPREKLVGDEKLFAYSIGSYPVNIGASFRNFNYRFYRAKSVQGTRKGITTNKVDSSLEKRLVFADWFKQGQGYSLGMLLGLPSLRLAFSKSRTEVERVSILSGLVSEKTRKESRFGFRVFPLGLLSYAQERKTRREEELQPSRPQPFHSLSKEDYSCLSIRPLGFVEVAIGSWDGSRAVGFRARILGACLTYAELKDFFRKIVGDWGDFMEDLHFYGFQLFLL